MAKKIVAHHSEYNRDLLFVQAGPVVLMLPSNININWWYLIFSGKIVLQ